MNNVYLLTTEANYKKELPDPDKTVLVEAQTTSHARAVGLFHHGNSYPVALTIPKAFAMPFQLLYRRTLDKLTGWPRTFLVQATVGYWKRMQEIQNNAHKESIDST